MCVCVIVSVSVSVHTCVCVCDLYDLNELQRCAPLVTTFQLLAFLLGFV